MHKGFWWWLKRAWVIAFRKSSGFKISISITMAIMSTWVVRAIEGAAASPNLFGNEIFFHITIRDCVVWTAVASLMLCFFMFKAAAERAKYDKVQDEVERIEGEFEAFPNPIVSNLLTKEILRALGDFAAKFRRMLGEGVHWTPGERFMIARDIFESYHKIKRYDATSCDPPYLSPAGLEAFFAQQKDKLKYSIARRLLVVPCDILMAGLLASNDNRTNFDAFLKAHVGTKVALRYWPQSLEMLEARIKSFGSEHAYDILVDFGIVDKEIVFGQARGPATEDGRVNGWGRIVTGSSVAAYVDAFDHIWTAVESETYPARYLDVLSLLCSMRSGRGNAGLSGQSYYTAVVQNILRSQPLWAIDVAQDISFWWRKPEYKDFLEASIAASKASTAQKSLRPLVSRMYVVGPHKVDEFVARTFFDEVVLGQQDAGIEVGITTRKALVEANVAAIDCIFGESWGFYLLPGDEFSPTHVSERANGVDANMRTELKYCFGSVRKLAGNQKYGIISTNARKLTVEEVINFLVKEEAST